MSEGPRHPWLFPERERTGALPPTTRTTSTPAQLGRQGSERARDDHGRRSPSRTGGEGIVRTPPNHSFKPHASYPGGSGLVGSLSSVGTGGGAAENRLSTSSASSRGNDAAYLGGELQYTKEVLRRYKLYVESSLKGKLANAVREIDRLQQLNNRLKHDNRALIDELHALRPAAVGGSLPCPRCGRRDSPRRDAASKGAGNGGASDDSSFAVRARELEKELRANIQSLRTQLSEEQRAKESQVAVLLEQVRVLEAKCALWDLQTVEALHEALNAREEEVRHLRQHMYDLQHELASRTLPNDPRRDLGSARETGDPTELDPKKSAALAAVDEVTGSCLSHLKCLVQDAEEFSKALVSVSDRVDVDVSSVSKGWSIALGAFAEPLSPCPRHPALHNGSGLHPSVSGLSEAQHDHESAITGSGLFTLSQVLQRTRSALEEEHRVMALSVKYLLRKQAELIETLNRDAEAHRAEIFVARSRLEERERDWEQERYELQQALFTSDRRAVAAGVRISRSKPPPPAPPAQPAASTTVAVPTGSVTVPEPAAEVSLGAATVTPARIAAITGFPIAFVTNIANHQATTSKLVEEVLRLRSENAEMQTVIMQLEEQRQRFLGFVDSEKITHHVRAAMEGPATAYLLSQ